MIWYHMIWFKNLFLLNERPDEWFNQFFYYVNYPILNDRLAIVRGNVIFCEKQAKAKLFRNAFSLRVTNRAPRFDQSPFDIEIITYSKRTIHFINCRPVSMKITRVMMTVIVKTIIFSPPILAISSLQQIERKLIARRVTFFAIQHQNLCLRTRKWLLWMLWTIVKIWIIQFVSWISCRFMNAGKYLKMKLENVFQIHPNVLMMWPPNLRNEIWQKHCILFGRILNE